MDCHVEKGNAWAWEAYKKWYGEAPEGHFSDLLAAGLTAPNGSQLLKKLAQDTLQPDIARASAIHGMRENALSEAEIQGVLAFLKDDAALVRGATLDFFGEQQNSSYTNHFWPLLKDAKRAVRVKAYFALAGQQSVPKGYEAIYKKVGEEFAHYLKATSDFVGGRVKQANYYLKNGELTKAIASYESAQKLDALDNNVRMTLGNLYYRNKQYDKAERAFRTIIEQEPEFGATYFTYALLLAEQERFNEAAQQLESSIAKAPDNQRAYYNLCLIYDRIGEKELAYTTALKGLEKQEGDVDLMYTLAFLYHKNGDSKLARPWVVKLIRLQPENQQFRAFLNEIDYGKQGNSGL
jgi:tetratricopeptide (TPR) repeat protein